jgi:hypothetical protein
MTEVFIIRNILEYADIGLEIFYNELKNIFYLKMNPCNKKFSSVNLLFSQIHLLHHENVVQLFNCQLSFVSSELILTSKDRPLSISFTELKEGEKVLKVCKKLHYRNITVEL